MTKEFYRKSEVLERLGITKWTLARWLKEGKLGLKPIQTGRLTLFDAKAVDAEIEALKAKAVSNG